MTDGQLKPLVSVLMPVYNAGKYLRDSLVSILNQTYRDIELIIIDDGSTDNCIKENEDIIKNDKRIRYIYQSNKGRPSALNHALEVMRGEFWLIQDADDVSHLNRIEKQYSALERDTTLAAVFCNNDLILPDGRLFAPTCMGVTTEECRRLIDNAKVPAHDATGMYRKEMVLKHLFDEDMWLIEGVDYVIRIGELYPMVVIPDCLYSHRVNYLSITHTRGDKISEATEKLKSKIALRRGIQSEHKKNKKQKKMSVFFRHRSFDTILPYAMKSVIQQRLCGRWNQALKTAITCAVMHPFDWYYYKPIVYSIIPIKLILLYQAWKKWKHVTDV